MKLSAKSLALTLGLLWGGAMLILGTLNIVIPPYGADVLVVMGSVYPGIYGAGTLSEALLGAAYGAIDGGLGGLLIAWLYNLVVERLGP
jgi:hypothetical protein